MGPPGSAGQWYSCLPTDVTWIRNILYYVEQTDATWDMNLPIVECPSDPRGAMFYNPNDTHSTTSYVACCGLDNNNAANTTGIEGIMHLNSMITMNQVSDGTSNTLLVVERPPAMMGASGDWGWWESLASDGGMGDASVGMKTSTWLADTSCPANPQFFAPDNVADPTNTAAGGDPTFCGANHSWSFHPGGVQC